MHQRRHPGYKCRMRFGPRLTTAALLVVGGLVPFALLAALVAGQWAPLRQVDADITGDLHTWALDHPIGRDVAVWCTNIFGPMPLRVAALGLVIWLVRRQEKRLAWWVAVTMVAGGTLGALLKLLVGRHRPDLLDPVAQATGFSFPSGHALNGALAAGVFVLVLLPVVRHRRLLWTGGAVVAGLAGVTRIVIGVHWTSDVVAGWLLGVAVVAATAMAFNRRGLESVVEEGVEPEMAEREVARPR